MKRITLAIIGFLLIPGWAWAGGPPIGSKTPDDTAYNATTWDGDTTTAPSKNAVRDKVEALQASDPDLTTIAALTCTENQIMKKNGAGAWVCAADADTGGTPVAITVANEAADETSFPLFVTAATGDLGPKSNAGLAFNAATGMLTVTGVTAPLTGNASTASALAADPADCGANAFATAIAASGALTCATPALGTDTSGNYVAGATATGGLTLTGTEGGTLGLTPCTGNENFIPKWNAATGWTCQADADSAGTPTVITVADSTSATAFCALFESATGDLAPKTDAGCTYNAQTGVLTVTGISIGSGGMAIAKVSGTAGADLLYEANSTDTNGTGWMGPASRASDLYLQFPDADPAANQFLLFPAPTAGTATGVWTTYGTFTNLTVILPSSDADPGTTAGTVRHDSSDTNASSGGTLEYYDGAQVRTVVDAGTNYTIVVKTEYLPVQYAEDGAAPPAAAAALASTRKVRTRAFDGASNENLEWHWLVPDDYVGGVKFRFVGYVPGATAPANTEVVAFSLAGCSVAGNEVLGCTAGDPQTSALTADANYVQYDRVVGAWSSAITLTGIAAGESAHMILIRLAESTDTYAQDFALAGIEIKYQAQIRLNSTY